MAASHSTSGNEGVAGVLLHPLYVYHSQALRYSSYTDGPILMSFATGILISAPLAVGGCRPAQETGPSRPYSWTRTWTFTLRRSQAELDRDKQRKDGRGGSEREVRKGRSRAGLCGSLLRRDKIADTSASLSIEYRLRRLWKVEEG